MKTLRLVVICGLLGAVALAVGCTVNPVTGESQLDLMGEAQEVQLGAQLYPRYTQSSLGEVGDPQLQAYVDEVGGKLAAVSHRPGLDYRYNAVNEPAVNAYALPGGKISITRGLLARLGSEDELAAVLGHETGHVTARHSAQQYTRAMLAQLALVGAAAYMEYKETPNRELYSLGGMVGAQLLMARYSRDQERQADELGLAYAVGAGYSPQGLVRLMEVLEDSSKRQPSLIERMFASHPMTAERIASARAAVSAQPPDVAARPLDQGGYRERTRQLVAARPAYDRLDEARSLLGQGSADKARGLLQRSVDEWPSDGILRAYLAIAEMELDHRQAAMSAADRAARDASTVFYPQALAGQVFLANDRLPEALARFDRAEELLPQVPEVSLMRGQALEKMRRTNEAIEAYRRVLELTSAQGETAQKASERLQALGALQPTGTEQGGRS